MRISDWSSDVCSSDLSLRCQNIVLLTIFILHQGDKCGAVGIVLDALYGRFHVPFAPLEIDEAVTLLVATRYTARCHMAFGIGRASCRERVRQYVSISVVAVSVKKKKNKKALIT